MVQPQKVSKNPTLLGVVANETNIKKNISYLENTTSASSKLSLHFK